MWSRGASWEMQKTKAAFQSFEKFKVEELEFCKWHPCGHRFHPMVVIYHSTFHHPLALLPAVEFTCLWCCYLCYFFGLYFVGHYFHVGSIWSIMSHVRSLVGGTIVQMWCRRVGLGCSPPVITEEWFTEVMSPQFEVAVDLYDQLVKVEELQNTANLEKRLPHSWILLISSMLHVKCAIDDAEWFDGKERLSQLCGHTLEVPGFCE